MKSCSIDVYEMTRKQQIASFGKPTGWKRLEEGLVVPSYIASGMAALFTAAVLLKAADSILMSFFPGLFS